MSDTSLDARDNSTAGSGDAPPETGLPQGGRGQGSAEQQYPGHRRRTRVLVAAATAAAVVGVTVALLAGSGSAPPSPLAVVTSALAETSASSYSFSLDSVARFAGHELHSDVVSGTFDPRHRLGVELLTAHSAGQTDRAQIRFVGKYLYTWVAPGSGMGTIGKPWDKSSAAAAAAAAMPPGDLYSFASDQPVSPDELAVVLRSAGVTVHDSGPVSGQGWTGTKYTLTALLYHGQQTISATVYLDQQGRVRRLTTITSDNAGSSGAANAASLTTDRNLTFGDFGAPVPVASPPASQVKYTSGQPYWGFYF